MRYTHVIFDVDETLVHSAQATLAALDNLLAERGLPPRTEEQRIAGVGTSPPSVEHDLGIKVDDSFLRDWIAHAGRVYMRHARLFEGVRPMLETLSGAGVSLGLVTSELRYELEQNFGQLGLLPFFGTVIARDDCTNGKPGPEPLQLYCERAGINAADALYVGDSLTDAECAEAAGMDFALACWSDVPQRQHIKASSYLDNPWDVVLLALREPSVAQREPWLAWARELQAIAQAGLYYTHDPYDVERFARVSELACECVEHLSGEPPQRVRDLFGNEDGYQTPKLDTRAVIFDEDGRLCMVNERQGGWTLPGGWVDQGQTLFSNAVKEAREEAGLEVVPEQVIALLEHNLHNPHPFPWGILKAFVLCRPVGGAFVENVETIERGFFSLDELPEPLLLAKSTRAQIEMCFAAHEAGNAWRLVVD